MTDDDLIRRGDALALQDSFMGVVCVEKIAAIPAVTPGVKVKPLMWENFDAWTHWAEGACGTYHVEKRNGYWRVELMVGGLVHGVTDTKDTTPEDLNTAKAAAQADYERRILAALDLTPQPSSDVAGLVEAHEEQLGVWADELMSDLVLNGLMDLADHDYDTKVGARMTIIAALKAANQAKVPQAAALAAMEGKP